MKSGFVKKDEMRDMTDLASLFVGIMLFSIGK